MKLQEFETKLDKKVKRLFESSVPKYYEHTLKVVSNMKKLYKASPLDKQLLLAAAYLHDIGYSLPYRRGFVGEIEDQNLKIEIHCREGSELAREILSELGVERSIVDRVAYLIKVHHRTDLDDEDLRLLLAADKV
ncbi:MAG: HD domain-containing protein [Candidatus Poribacteria bacterium]